MHPPPPPTKIDKMRLHDLLTISPSWNYRKILHINTSPSQLTDENNSLKESNCYIRYLSTNSTFYREHLEIFFYVIFSPTKNGETMDTNYRSKIHTTDYI